MSKKPHRKGLADSNNSAIPFPIKIGIGLLTLLHVVCPLLFFTNLTRNPYYTQIALLNIGIALCGLCWAVQNWRSGTWTLPRTSFEIPLLIFLVVAINEGNLSVIRISSEIGKEEQRADHMEKG